MDLNREESRVLETLDYAPPVTLKMHMKDVNIVLLFGCTGTGKTSFANIASGGDMEVGRGIRSSTKYLEESKVFRVDDQSVVVVDCPGFNDTYLTETEILRRLAEYLKKAYENKCQIAGLLYMHKISDTRVGGASFRHMNMFKALCGSDAFKNVVYVTNMWSTPPTEDEMFREEELRNTEEFFGEPLAKGAQVARHNNTEESAHNIIRKLLGRGHVVTRLQRQLLDEKLSLEETEVGLVIGRDLEDERLRQQQEMDELKIEKEKAQKSNDYDWLRRLEAQEERAKVREQQLAEHLRALKSGRAKQSQPTNQQVRAVQNKFVTPDFSSVWAKVEAKTDKSRSDAHPSHSSDNQDWNERRDEENRRDIARIKAVQRSHAAYSDPRSNTAWEAAGQMLGAVGGAMMALYPRRNRAAPLAIRDRRHTPGTHSPDDGSCSWEDVGGSFGSRSNQTPYAQDLKRPQGKASSSSRSRPSSSQRNIHNERGGDVLNSRRLSHDQETSMPLSRQAGINPGS